MRGSVIVRIENRRGDPQQRCGLVVATIRGMSDAELFDRAHRRPRSNPPRDLRPVSITLPADVLERLEMLKPPVYSVSALVDSILAE